MKEEKDYYHLLIGENMHIIVFPYPTRLRRDYESGQVIIEKKDDCNKIIYAVFNKDINIFKRFK